MKRLAIIPARGGSKRIPRKNIKDFCGHPMISYPIKAAANAKIFDTIHVSTDSLEISDVAGKYGHLPDFLRPENISDDHVPMMECLKYVVKRYEDLGHKFDTVALIYATSPLIDAEDLKLACHEFEKTDRHLAMLAVTSYPSPVEHAFRMDENSNLYPDKPEALSKRTQDLPEAMYDAGMFAFYSSDHLKNSNGAGNFFGFKGFKVPATRVTDIDWPDDWIHAEALYKALFSDKS